MSSKLAGNNNKSCCISLDFSGFWWSQSGLVISALQCSDSKAWFWCHCFLPQQADKLSRAEIVLINIELKVSDFKNKCFCQVVCQNDVMLLVKDFNSASLPGIYILLHRNNLSLFPAGCPLLLPIPHCSAHDFIHFIGNKSSEQGHTCHIHALWGKGLPFTHLVRCKMHICHI